MTTRLVRDRATWALYAAVALFACLETGLGPAMPFVRDGLHLSHTIASLHFSAFAAGAIVAGAVGGLAGSGLGWQAALLLSLPALLLVRIAFRTAEISSPATPPMIQDRSAGRLARPFWLACGVMFLASGAEWCMAY